MTGCVCIDLSLMRSVRVDPKAATAEIGGGCLIGDVDDACKEHGLALPMGHVYHTGVAGMALNATSGVGYLARTRGLTVTYLREVTMVTADGKTRTVSDATDSDLFWATQGAGANFGVVTSMIFNLTKVPPKVLAGDVVKFPLGSGPPCGCLNSGKSRYELVQHFVDFYLSAPDECSALLVIAPQKASPVVYRVCYIPKESDAEGDAAAARAAVARGREVYAPLLGFGNSYSLLSNVKPRNYHSGLQKMGQFKPSYYYQKAVNCTAELPAEVLRQLCAQAEAAPIQNMGTAIIMQRMGGAMGEMASDRTPTADIMGRLVYWVIIIAEFPKGGKDADMRDACIKWGRETYEVVKPYRSLDPQGARTCDYWSEVLGDIYGANTPRLVELKTKYDPDNFFCHNRNVKAGPSGKTVQGASPAED